MTDRAEQMREAALRLEKQLARSPAHFIHMEQWQGYKDGVQDYAKAIRALPLPPQPPLPDYVAELEKANNEFGSQTANWPDLWKRIADLKEQSNARWLRAEKSEAEVARLREALVMLNDKALMNAGEFAKYVRGVSAAALEPKGTDHE